MGSSRSGHGYLPNELLPVPEAFFTHQVFEESVIGGGLRRLQPAIVPTTQIAEMTAMRERRRSACRAQWISPRRLGRRTAEA